MSSLLIHLPLPLSLPVLSGVRVVKATGTPATPQPSLVSGRGGVFVSSAAGSSELLQDGLNSISAVSDVVSAEAERYTSVAPTMWLGAQSGR